MSARLCSFQSKAGVFTPEECASIRELGSKLALEEARTHKDETGDRLTLSRRICDIKWVKSGHEGWDWVFERITKEARAMNDARWDFEVQDAHSIQYTSYSMGGFYSPHFDNGSKTTQHRKLSVSIQITPPKEYVGGKLRLWSMNDTRMAPKELGSMTCFPSYLMHVAKPVWWGRREVLVTWLDGPTKLR